MNEIPAGHLERSRAALSALLRAADRIRRDFASLLEPEGITPQQYNVVRILRGAGADGLPTMEVRRRMLEQAAGITGLVDRLERKGWVQRRAAGHDRREKRCHITAEGTRLLARLEARVNAFDADTFAALSSTQLARWPGQLDSLRPHTT